MKHIFATSEKVSDSRLTLEITGSVDSNVTPERNESSGHKKIEVQVQDVAEQDKEPQYTVVGP